MKTLILLGTPKKKLETSSSSFIANAMSGGMTQKPEILVIAHEKAEIIAEAVKNSDTILLIAPNYIHSIPAHVLNTLYTLPENDASKSFAVIIQSGFTEERDSVYIKRYIDGLIPRLGYKYLGCAVMGDSAAYGLFPEMCRKRIPIFEELGSRFEKNNVLDLEYIVSSGISTYDVLPEKMVKKLEFIRKIGLGKLAWISLLNSHKAYKKRYDRPYL